MISQSSEVTRTGRYPAGEVTDDSALERRRRLTHRALPLGAMALVALTIGLVCGSAFDSSGERAAREFAVAWTRGDYRSMHDLLDAGTRSRYPLKAFRAAYEEAAATATATAVLAGKPDGSRDDRVRIPVRVSTRVFGTIDGEVLIATRGDDVQWRPNLVFPGLRVGERLERETRAPERATILAADGAVLAEGAAEQRTSPPDGVGSLIAGSLEVSADPAERERLVARGFDADTPVGATGLERVFQARVEGEPGGVLRAGERELARSEARAAAPVRSTIAPDLQAAADAALAGRLGGIAVLDPRTARIRALAGIAFSAPQPPGSTFKLVTTAAALEEKLVKPSDDFPVVSEATIDGVALQNANGELCGGSFTDSFAHSCNSVFAPLGVEIGGERLVAEAEAFGWNAPPSIPGEAPSTLPREEGITTPLEVGSSAIGQGKVLATPLRMASVAQAIANDGILVEPTLAAGREPVSERVTPAAVARTIGKLMVGVVEYGTGPLAAVPGVQVAGKTGTAELEDTRGPTADDLGPDPSNTDAWFTSYAPAKDPRIVVAVLLVRNGAGGTTAAPAAQQVLAAALDR